MPQHYAVIGNPIAHSKSPLIHAEFARQTGRDMVYTAIFAPLDAFAATVKAFQSEGGKGVNITVPFKREAWKSATRLTVRARMAEAVNTLKFEEDGSILGDNTDGAGLVRDLCENLKVALTGRQILLMGAGGAARGVLSPLLAQQPAALFIANRTIAKAAELARHFDKEGRIAGGGYEDIAGRAFDLVINATSSSLADESPPLSPEVFAPGALAYDMMYGKGLTPFLRFAREHGVTHLADGLGMLVEQAAESFTLWHSVRPETVPVIERLRAGLSSPLS